MIEGVVALLLAAGAGRRMGGPKALRRTVDGRSWAAARAADLAAGGCAEVVVVLGAEAEAVERTLPHHLSGVAGTRTAATIVVAPDWDEGMAASLKAGLHHLASRSDGWTAALVALVDTPDVGPAIVARLVAVAESSGAGVLARAAYRGRGGHPVLLGRDHWAAVVAVARGDSGARSYLAVQDVALIECGDLGDDRDLDHSGDLDHPGDESSRLQPPHP